MTIQGYAYDGVDYHPGGRVFGELVGNDTWTRANDFSAGVVHLPVVSALEAAQCTATGHVGRDGVKTLGTDLYVPPETSPGVYGWVTK